MFTRIFKRLIVLCFIVTFAGNSMAKPPSQSCLSGTWQNELGSNVTLNHNCDGKLSGEYWSSVGTPGKEPSPLSGFSDPNSKSNTLGFIVSWNDGTSLTTWAGEYFCDDKPTIMTMWILSSSTGNPEDYWGSNRIGQDIFHRVTT
ncbi:avidin-like isoform X2 [Ptychodera flava]|uniref:avidin-like isoform X2 n=1 Tax=Ptychodera flava TaxID=63121 RepID=UPI003969C0A9